MTTKSIKIISMYIPAGGHDYWCDAYIEEAEYSDGTLLTDTELDELNNDSDYVFECVENYIY